MQFPSSTGRRESPWAITVLRLVLPPGYPDGFLRVFRPAGFPSGLLISGTAGGTARSCRVLIHRVPAGTGRGENSPSPVLWLLKHPAGQQNIHMRILPHAAMPIKTVLPSSVHSMAYVRFFGAYGGARGAAGGAVFSSHRYT